MADEKAIENPETASEPTAERPRYSRRLKTGLFIALSVSVVTVVAILYVTMDRSTWSAIAKISPIFFIVAMLLVALKWASACLRTNLLVRASGSRLSLGKTSKAVIGGSFVGSVTPFQAGGIPAEIYFLHGYGLSTGKATAVVSTSAAISTLFFLLAMPLVLSATAAQINVGFGARTVLVAVGVFSLFFLLAVAYSMRKPYRVAGTLRAAAPAFLKKRAGFERAVGRLSNAIADFSASLRVILRCRRSVLAAAVVLTFTFWASGFMVAPVILWGLGYPELFWKAMLAQLVVSCVMPFLPVPGGSGFAESAFAGVFSLFVPRHLVGFVTLSWRFLLFYLVLVVQGVLFVIALRDSARAGSSEAGMDDGE